MKRLMPFAFGAVTLLAPLLATAASAQDAAVKAPSLVDEVQRGMRLRLDLGGRYVGIGQQAPPILLEVGANDTTEEQDTKDDIDVTGTILFGWDRPFGAPIKADLFAQGAFDLNTAGARDPFFDGQSFNAFSDPGQIERYEPVAARLRLFSAFVGASFGPDAGILSGLEANIGRMTQMVLSPITYDGVSLGGKYKFGDIKLRARLWGGVDSPNWTVDDPFSRSRQMRFVESVNPDFAPQTNAVLIDRTYNAEPVFNIVGGLDLDVDAFGFKVNFDHASLAVQRTVIGVGYGLNYDFLLGNLRADLQMTDFVPRATRVFGDFMLPGRLDTHRHATALSVPRGCHRLRRHLPRV